MLIGSCKGHFSWIHLLRVNNVDHRWFSITAIIQIVHFTFDKLYFYYHFLSNIFAYILMNSLWELIYQLHLSFCIKWGWNTEKNDYLLRCCRFTGDTATFSKSVPLFEVHLRIGATGIPRGRCMVSTYKFPNLLVILCNCWSKWEQVLIKGYVSTHYLIAFYFKIFEYLV